MKSHPHPVSPVKLHLRIFSHEEVLAKPPVSLLPGCFFVVADGCEKEDKLMLY
jgi:hypothetical protein